MDYCIRDSGIDLLGDIPWGTHIAQLFEYKEDYYKIMVPFLQSGLINNEVCVWIYDGQDSDREIIEMIGRRIGNIEKYLERGQLRVFRNTEWYLEDENFSEIRVSRKWNNLIQEALDNGYDGLRAVADVTCLLERYWGNFSQYEEYIQKTITELPFIAACLYNTARLGPFEIGRYH